ncbi:MAG TPA: hypothetical protein VL172_04760, partial [Kofleriaceae bacterium]|nr:hypothetical protein [Kofleriaceae bacterium]
ACRHACAHRSECVTGADVKACIPDCAALVIASKQDPQAVLGDYIKQDCDTVKKGEPVMTCLHACTYVLGCGVAGDLSSCLGYCSDQLEQGATEQQVAELGKADCATVKAKIQLPQPKSGILCRAEGVYTVCDGSMCIDHPSDSMGAGTNQQDAQLEAVQSCSNHMLSLVAIQSINNRASVKQDCRILGCN